MVNLMCGVIGCKVHYIHVAFDVWCVGCMACWMYGVFDCFYEELGFVCLLRFVCFVR